MLIYLYLFKKNDRTKHETLKNVVFYRAIIEQKSIKMNQIEPIIILHCDENISESSTEIFEGRMFRL